MRAPSPLAVVDALPRRVRGTACAVLGAVVLVVVVPGVLGHRAPAGVVLQGMEFGAAYGLLAIGLVLTYRSTRVVNFAYGAMGGMAGTFGVMLYLGQHWSWFAALGAGVGVGALTGAAVDLLVVRRFFNAPRIILTVATIGLAQVFGGIQALVPSWLGGPPFVGAFRTPLTSPHVQVDTTIFTGNDLVLVVAAAVVLVVLGWFLLRTDAGVAVRSVADNAERAQLCGIPVKLLSTLVWTVAGALAALTILLGAPSTGVTLTVNAGPALLLFPLAAAVVARMESLPIAMGAGVVLGVVNQVVQFDVSKQSISDVVAFVVVLAALLVQRRRLSRAQDVDGSWQATGILKPIPDALRRLPEVIAGRTVLGLGLLALLLAVPYMVGPGTTLQFTFAIVYGVIALSLVLLSGWSGNISLGQFALAGMGGVVAGDLMSKWNVDLFACLVAAGAAGAGLAVLVGLPALRVRGLFLAVTTLALAVAMDGFFFNPTNFPRALPAAITAPVLWKRFDLASLRAEYYFCLAVLAVVVVFVKGLRRARPGRVLLATRDNERAAAAMAVPTVRVKLSGFVLAGVIAGVGGALYAMTLGGVGSETFNPSLSTLVLVMAVIGGLGSISGALLGVAVIEVTAHLLPQYYFIITGVGLVWILAAFPGGIGEGVHMARDRLLRVVARRRGLVVPSLVADRAEASHPGTTAEPVAHVGDGVPPMLRCRSVEVSYGPVQVLFGVDLDVHEGEVVALLGTNGAGKSTLLKAVCGLARTDRGTVELEGVKVNGTLASTMARHGVGLMPGGRGVFPTLSVEENLRLGTWMVRKDAAKVASARRRALELFPALTPRLGQMAGNLSGGEQQMLSLALALATDPRLLLIDELSLGLAPTVVGQLLDVVGALHESGTTIVVVEQSVNVALQLADRAVFMEKGEVRFVGATAELLDRPDVLRSVFIAGAAAHEQGAPARAAAPAPPTATPADTAPVVLECREVTKSFGGIRAVDGINMTLREGEILGLIGHNGAGKTTLFDLVSGFTALDRGRVLLGSVDIGTWPDHMRAVAGIGRTSQEARLFPALTVRETIAVSLERHLASKSVVAAGLRLPACLDSEADVAAKVAELVERFGLDAYAEKLVGELSTGTRRIVELACVLAQDPAVVLLDEPSGGVAQRETEALGPLLRRVQEHSGCAILVIEHDMPLLTSLCDRMIALELGQVIATGTPAEILEHPRVIESYLGTDMSALERSGARSLSATR